MNGVKAKEKQENGKFEIQQSGYFFMGERSAIKERYTEGFRCTSNILFWVIIQVNFIINLSILYVCIYI